jgi:hypothetical protein
MPLISGNLHKNNFLIVNICLIQNASTRSKEEIKEGRMTKLSFPPLEYARIAVQQFSITGYALNAAIIKVNLQSKKKCLLK